MEQGTSAERTAWKGKVIAVVVLAAASVAALLVRSPRGGRLVANEGLVVAEHSLRFDEAWVGSTFDRVVTIANPTAKEVIIDSFATSCSCLGVEPPDVTIPPGGQADIRLKINLAPEKVESTPEGKDLTVVVVPRIRDALPQQEGWVVRGQVRHLFRLSPAHVQLSEVIEGQVAPVARVVARPAVQLRSLKATCAADQAAVEVVPGGSASEEYRVGVRVRPRSPGPFRFEVTLTPAAERGGPLPDVRFPVEGVVLPRVQPLPQALLLAARPVGEVVSEQVVLTSLSGDAFEVRGFEVSADDLRVEAIPESGGKTFRVSQRIAKPGEQVGKATFQVSMRDGQQATVPLEVRYVGLPPSQ
jgi:hypothetical protein